MWIQEALTGLANTLGVDFVVEQGANFRKWNSGTLEQWGNGTIAGTSGNGRTTISLPREFIDTNYSVTLGGGGSASSAVALSENDYTSANRVRTTKSFVVSAYKTGYAYTITFGWYVVGRWK